jgi:hypothetical protein
VGASARNGHDSEAAHDHSLESEVDVHAFAPVDLERSLGSAGFESIRIRGEELLANVYGWWLRSLESSAEPDEVPDGWRLFAYRSYMTLQRADVALLEPRLPASLFYNLILSARKPGELPERERVAAHAG